MDTAALEGWLRLQCTAGVGPRTAHALLRQFGSPAGIFQRTTSDLAGLVSPTIAQALQTPPSELTELLHNTVQWFGQDPSSRRCWGMDDPDYPASLRQLDDPPLLLWATGPQALWEQGGLNALTPRSIAVVGSRNPTPQGVENARMFAAALAQAGLCVVSGLALGIDGAAHEGALDGAPDALASTVAVVGTGLDRVYPKQHHALAHRIGRQGVIVSEFPLGTPPLAANFPRRNRILCGLAQGTLVVEAALASGSLITAQQTLEQGKDVFAIPGSIHATQARGCHKLIKEGAKLVEGAQDILDELAWGRAAIAGQVHTIGTLHPITESDSCVESPLSDAEHAVLQALGYDIASLDVLQARTGMDTASLQARLMTLELADLVRRLPGGHFQRVVQA